MKTLIIKTQLLMKKILLIILTAAIITSCKEGSSGIIKHPRHDTIGTLVLYQDIYDTVKVLKHDVIARVTIDTMKFIKKDSSTLKKEWTVDTMYYIQEPIYFNDTTGKPVLDSAGKRKSELR